MQAIFGFRKGFWGVYLAHSAHLNLGVSLVQVMLPLFFEESLPIGLGYAKIRDSKYESALGLI